MKLTIVTGARWNFIKIAPIIKVINESKRVGKNIDFRLVHTGQHYDKAMSGRFFEQLNIPEPSVNLECGGGTQAEQTAAVMVAFEKELKDNTPDWVVVVGDVTSTMACAIVAKKLQVRVAHVEGGIRSNDITMPEEINRLVTDSITDIFFTTSKVANLNLRSSGVSEEKIQFVGNTMIDTLLQFSNDLLQPKCWSENNLKKGEYFVMTLHRPSNVDNKVQLSGIFSEIDSELMGGKVIFPVHPRTKKNMEQYQLSPKNVILVEPLSYLEFNYLVSNARGVITDSGGITEETTVMGIPCITMRDSTERPETIDLGTNELIGSDYRNLGIALRKLMNGDWKKGSIPPLWDGKTSKRIVNWFLYFNNESI